MTDLKQPLQDQIKTLKDEYGAKLPERLDELDAAFADLPDDIRAVGAHQALETLYALSHKLNGSAGTFGFKAISDTAERLEARCRTLLDDADSAPADGRADIADLVAAVRDAARPDAG